MDYAKILNILGRFVQFEKKDITPYEDSGINEDVIVIRVNMETDLTVEEYKLMRSWLDGSSTNGQNQAKKVL